MSEHDERTGKTRLQVKLEHPFVSIVLTGTPGAEPGDLRLTFGRASPQPVFADCQGIDFVLNDVVTTAPPEAVSHQATAGSEGTAGESLTVSLSIEQVRALAAAKSLKLRACRDSLTLSMRHHGLLRAFVERWDAEAAKAPRPGEPQGPAAPPDAVESGRAPAAPPVEVDVPASPAPTDSGAR